MKFGEKIKWQMLRISYSQLWATHSYTWISLNQNKALYRFPLTKFQTGRDTDRPQRPLSLSCEEQPEAFQNLQDNLIQEPGPLLSALFASPIDHHVLLQRSPLLLWKPHEIMQTQTWVQSYNSWHLRTHLLTWRGGRRRFGNNLSAATSAAACTWKPEGPFIITCKGWR